jgi:glutathione S-transferase
MKFYYSPGACSLAPHIVAQEAGITLQLARVDLKTHTAEDADFYLINPKGYVPALVLDDGQVLTENQVVMQYLADLAPQARLAPPPGSFERYRLQEWLAFISSELHKNFRPLIRGAPQETIEDARQKILSRLSFIEERLEADYLMGNDFSAADAYLFVMLCWVRMIKLDIAKHKRLAAFFDRVADRPKVRAAMDAEGLQLASRKS